MDIERIKEVHSDFKNALERLREALNEDLGKGDIVIDGAIQRFEFTFELSWKLAMRILDYNGIEASAPRLVIKEAYKAGIFEDGESWIDMLEDRNKTSHIYDEKTAKDIYNKIKNYHFRILEKFALGAEKFIK